MTINTDNDKDTDPPQADAIVPVGNPTIPAANGTNFFEHLPDELIVLIMMYLFDRAALKETPALAQFKASCRRFYGVAKGERERPTLPQALYRIQFPLATRSLFGGDFPQNINWGSLLSFEQQQPTRTRYPLLRNRQRVALAEQFSRLRTLHEEDPYYVSPDQLQVSYDKQHTLLSRIISVRNIAQDNPANQFCQWFYETRVRGEYQYIDSHQQLITHTEARITPRITVGHKTLLHWAALLADGETMTALLAQGHEFNLMAEATNTLNPLMSAIFAHNLPALRALLENNAVIVAYANQLRNSQNMSPFEVAVKHNNPAALKLLVANSTLREAYLRNIVVNTHRSQRTVLNFLGANSSIRLVNTLLNHFYIRQKLSAHYEANPDNNLINRFIREGRGDIIKAIFTRYTLKLALISPLFPDNGQNENTRAPLETAIRCDNTEIATLCLNDHDIYKLQAKHSQRSQAIVLAAANRPDYDILNLLFRTNYITNVVPFNDLLYEIARQPLSSHPKKHELLTWLLPQAWLWSYYQTTYRSKSPLYGAMEGDDLHTLQLLCANTLLRKKFIIDIEQTINKNPLFACKTMSMLEEILKHDDLVLACAAHPRNEMGDTPPVAILFNNKKPGAFYDIALRILEHEVIGPAMLTDEVKRGDILKRGIPKLSLEQYKRLLTIDLLKQDLTDNLSLSKNLLCIAKDEKKPALYNLILEHCHENSGPIKAYNKKGVCALSLALKNSQLSHDTKHVVLQRSVNAYIAKRKTEPTQIRSFGIFGKFGYKKEQKLAAAAALQEAITHQTPLSDLKKTPHYPLLRNARLGKIYKAALEYNRQRKSP